MALLLIAVVLLATANGANDLFKSTATLWGSRTVGYTGAALCAAAGCLAGAAWAVWLPAGLLDSLRNSLIGQVLGANPSQAAAVALGAAGTVWLASRCGLPVSTTHALLGAFLGLSLACDLPFDYRFLVFNFALPLLLAPLWAMTCTAVVYRLLARWRQRLGLSPSSCVCLPHKEVFAAPCGEVACSGTCAPVVIGTLESCSEARVSVRLSAPAMLATAHVFSALALGFARSLNDVCKIGWFVLALDLPRAGVIWLTGIGILMVGGGLVGGRRVASVMGFDITALNTGQAFTANLLSSVTVGAASVWGWPVSTTHVMCGALFGIGAATRQARQRAIVKIVLAWLGTVPLAAALSALATSLLR